MEERISTPVGEGQGAIARAWADLRALSSHWLFRILAAVLTAAFAIWGAMLPLDASTQDRVLLAVGGTLGGALVLGVLAFTGLLLTAPIRQRDEARRAIQSLERSSEDPERLVRQFSAWVQTVRSALPEYPRFRGPLFVLNSDARDKQQVDHASAVQRYREAKDDVERQARREYHDRFREGLVELIGEPHTELADNPRDIADFEEIERDVVRRYSESQQVPPPEEAVSRVLRRVIGVLVAELRAAEGVITAALERQVFWPRDGGLSTTNWDQIGSDLVEHGLVDVHAVAADAYGRMEALNHDALDTWSAMEAHYHYDPPPGKRPTIRGNETSLAAAVDAIAAAEAALTQSRP